MEKKQWEHLNTSKTHQINGRKKCKAEWKAWKICYEWHWEFQGCTHTNTCWHTMSALRQFQSQRRGSFPPQPRAGVSRGGTSFRNRGSRDERGTREANADKEETESVSETPAGKESQKACCVHTNNRSIQKRNVRHRKRHSKTWGATNMQSHAHIHHMKNICAHVAIYTHAHIYAAETRFIFLEIKESLHQNIFWSVSVRQIFQGLKVLSYFWRFWPLMQQSRFIRYNSMYSVSIRLNYCQHFYGVTNKNWKCQCRRCFRTL